MPTDIPTSTYRLQFTREFGFDDAARVVPYLRALGISHVYASPFLKARSGSTHGYDIVDHAALNPELGGEEAFGRLSDALRDADIGLILDFVPNHMGVGRDDNGWWLDVLEWGPRSPHARAFDIDWESLPNKPEGGVLLPILGGLYGDVLEAGEIALKYHAGEGSFSAWYYEHRLPIRPNRYGDIIRTVVTAAGANGVAAGRRLMEVASLYPDPRDPARDEAPAFKAALAGVEGGAEIIARGLSAYTVSPDDPSAVVALHRLLERQHYRLAHWRVAVSEINYRRFFDINDLAGLRVEDMHTFTAVHRLVIRLIADGRLHGLRLDHIDGLHDPAQYTDRLQRLVRRVRGGGSRSRPFYVLVEKILGEGEAMPRLPGVAGTTGYEALNEISRLLVDGRGLPTLRATAAAETGLTQPFEEVVRAAKWRVLDSMLASEFTVLARQLARIAVGHWRTRDYPFDRLRAALRFYVLNFPVYRSYVTPDGPGAGDRAVIARAIAAARAEWFGPDAAIFDFLQDALTLDLVAPGRAGYSRARVVRFALKVQQLTGPVMAKSLEDTAFYRYVPLLALNEVGGEPDLPGLAPDEFHARMQARGRAAPHALTATATHDTKRGEDARARILVLSEMAEEWRSHAEHWASLNAPLAGQVNGRRAPSRLAEYLIYQTLMGAWPSGDIDAAFVSRIEAYAIKAAREAKLETSWMNANEPYEAALQQFVRDILDPARSPGFIDSAAALAGRIGLVGALNGLVQLTLKATMPGVPDFYQGTEGWDFSLVDPDNRRPVDFVSRATDLAAIGDAPDWEGLVRSFADGRIKLALTRRLVALRQELPRVFAGSGYRALPVSGRDGDHLVAFARGHGREAVVVVVGRHFLGTTDGGRAWQTGAEWDAVVDLQGFRLTGDALGRGPVPEGTTLPASAFFGPLPVFVAAAVPPGVSPRPAAPRARRGRPAPARGITES